MLCDKNKLIDNITRSSSLTDRINNCSSSNNNKENNKINAISSNDNSVNNSFEKYKKYVEYKLNKDSSVKDLIKVFLFKIN